MSKYRRMMVLLGVMAVIAVALGLWLSWPRSTPGLPPFSESPFLNSGPDAQYVGVAACAECHPRQYQSYRLTAHSKALADLDPSAEPPDAAFDHGPSGRSYRVYRKEGKLHHQEVLRSAEGKEIAQVDLPIRYVVGSGNFTRSYLVEVDGFLHESPITWYTSKQRWGLSPGYDLPNPMSFERPVDLGCLFCHAGRVTPGEGSAHRLRFHEQTIGCENCHGPGALHQERRRARQQPGGEDDLTIVHPGKLTRPLQEAICAACHLTGAADVPLRGRTITDYRPGRPLSDYRIHYRLDRGDQQMTVVGHVEQLRLSACYQKSPDLTCITCHDPHQRAAPADRVAFYRQKCLSCHAEHGCRVERVERLKRDATDNCAACHMPRGDTEIPHIAFTHHRIGRHAAPPPFSGDGDPELVAEDDAHLAPVDRQRNLGMAYLQASHNDLYAAHAETFRQRARRLLDAAYAAGLRDVDTVLALSELYWPVDSGRAVGYARQALATKDVSAKARSLALNVIANVATDQGDFPTATAALEELVRLRRFTNDWCLLGASYQQQHEPRKALTAMQQALAIRPYRPSIHAALADLYRELGDPGPADEHLEKARWLFLHRQD